MEPIWIKARARGSCSPEKTSKEKLMEAGVLEKVVRRPREDREPK